MEGEWHTLHRIEEVSNLISLLREYKTNTITRNGVQQSRWFTLSLLQSFQRCICLVEHI